TIKQNVTDLVRAIEATPANEMALSSLDREYRNVQAQYNAAAARLADASTGQQLEFHSKGERLSILEMAFPPESAIGPKRLYIVVGSLVAGLALGTGLVFALEMLNNTVRRPVGLRQKLQMQ